MAGETPGADMANQARADRRKRLTPNDRNTNRYYASGNASALDSTRTVADSTLKHGQTPKPIPTPKYNKDDRNANKYYADPKHTKLQGPVKPRKGVHAQKPQPRGQKPLGPAPKLGTIKVGKRTGLVILDPKQVVDAVGEVRDRLNQGEAPVTVHIKAGDSRLLRRMRASVEMLVTREEITEEQGRDVVYEYLPADSTPEMTPEGVEIPAETKSADVDVSNLDFEAILSGRAPMPQAEEEEVDTTPQDRVEVDIAAETEKLVPDDDFGADNDFLDPKVENQVSGDELEALVEEPTNEPDPEASPTIKEPVAEAPAEVAAPVEEVQASPRPSNRKGRRAGRGSS